MIELLTGMDKNYHVDLNRLGVLASHDPGGTSV
jgi:hypothetical protein